MPSTPARSARHADTLLEFRRLPEQHDLTAATRAAVDTRLGERGLLRRQVTVVGLTLVAAPSKAQLRALVEHPFRDTTNLFGSRKVGDRGLARNEARAMAHAALARLYLARRRWKAPGGSVRAWREQGPDGSLEPLCNGVPGATAGLSRPRRFPATPARRSRNALFADSLATNSRAC